MARTMVKQTETEVIPPGKDVSLNTKSTELANYDSSLDTGETGLENVTAKDLLIPRITILQALSPQLSKSKPEYIEDAEVGMFCDTATGELYGEMELLPVFYAKVFLEWFPRKSGKGLAVNHGTDPAILKSCAPDDKGRPTLRNGNYIAETATFYCLNGMLGWRRCFVPLASTQLKASRKWLSLITAERVRRPNGSEFQPPMWYRPWLATTTQQSNSEGEWFGWKFAPASRTIMDEPNWKDLLFEAQSFYHDARDGLVHGDIASISAEPDAEEEKPM